MNANDDDEEDFLDPEDFDELDRHEEAIRRLIDEYEHEHDLGDGLIAALLAAIAIKMRMTGYVLNVENPSASGLKLDLDRFKRDIDSFIRDARKDADVFVKTAKAVIEETLREGDIANDEDDEDDEE